MTRFINRLPLSVVVSIVVLIAAELSLRVLAGALPAPQEWSSEEAQAKVAQLGCSEPCGGVVFLGSSVIDVGVDAARFEEKAPWAGPAYNAALRGASIRMIDVWAREVVVPRREPDLVVIGVSSRELNPNDGAQRTAETEFFDAPAVREMLGTGGLLDRMEDTLAGWFELVRYRAVLRRPVELFRDRGGVMDSGVVLDDHGHDGGFSRLGYRMDRSVRRSFRNGPLRDYRVDEARLAALRDLVLDVKHGGTTVVLLDVPVTADYASMHPGGDADYAAFERALSELADDTGAPLLRPGVWPNDSFVDPYHLNGRGASVLTDYLAAELSRLGMEASS